MTHTTTLQPRAETAAAVRTSHAPAPDHRFAYLSLAVAVAVLAAPDLDDVESAATMAAGPLALAA